MTTATPPGPDLLEHLRRVKTLRFSSTSRRTPRWNGEGHGQVDVECPSPELVIFREAGHWQADHAEQGLPLRFSNVYRWSADRAATGSHEPAGQQVRLAHLRRGPDQPVDLLDMRPVAPLTWQCAAPHSCGDDLYRLHLTVEPSAGAIHMRWTINGPHKCEELNYLYGMA